MPSVFSRSRGWRGRQQEPLVARAAQESAYVGTIKSYAENKGFGFIACDETFSEYKKDVFLHKMQIGDFKKGDRIRFDVEVRNGQPQARNLQEASDDDLSEIDRAWLESERDLERSTEASGSNDQPAPVVDDIPEAREADAATQPREQTDVTNKPPPDLSEEEVKEASQEAERLGVNPFLARSVVAAKKALKALENDMLDMSKFTKKELGEKSREMSRLTRVAQIYNEIVDVAGQAADAQAMAAGEDELAMLAKEEAQSLNDKKQALLEDLQTQMLPVDVRDEAKSVLIEIRPGVGGDEAGLWAGDLMEMYQKYCDMEGLKWEVHDMTEKEGGGLVDVTLRVQGAEAYSKLKFESGVHRVQRVPATETAGRTQTSTAKVVVLPEIEFEAVELDEKDLKFTFCRAGGKGGQKVNKIETACHCWHIPSGIHVFSKTERSQLQNKENAKKWIASMLLDRQMQEYQASESSRRKSLVGSGDRSEKIRSYNFKAARVSDHRLGENFPLSTIMAGNLQKISEQMRLLERKDKLLRMEDKLKQLA